MDITAAFPPTQEGKTVSNSIFKGFAVSLQGASHLQNDPPVPCQDYSDVCLMETEKLLVAAIADGVGSCPLSHWGAYTAVTTVLELTQKGLKELAGGQALILDFQNDSVKKALKCIMEEAFDGAVEAVENCADRAEPPQAVFSLQSTLSLAIYDGTTLFHGHVGDDGIVAQTQDGKVFLATQRLKGEEASSVYPLQSGPKMWRFGATSGVTAFVMATDGVLDAFVARHTDAFNVNYNNGVYYGFMEDAVYGLAKQEPDEVLSQYKAYLLSDEYRESVTDDLTMVCAVSNEGIQKGIHPPFSEKIWRTIEEESTQYRKLRLAGKPVPSGERKRMDVEPDRDAPTPAVTVESPERKSKRCGKSLKVGVAAAALVLCLGGGLVAGRCFFPQMTTADYSQAVQRCEELEQQQKQTEEKLEQKTAELEQKTAELEQAEKQNGQLQYRLDHVRIGRDYYHRKLIDMEKKLDTLGTTLEEENP